MTPDESRSAAKKLWDEAEDMRATGVIESLRAAMSKYENALRLLRSAGKAAEPGEIAYTLNQLAAVADSLGDRRQAINYYKQALPLWREANDRQSEAGTLTRLGRVHNSLGDKQEAQRLFDRARLIVQTSSLMRTFGDENLAAFLAPIGRPVAVSDIDGLRAAVDLLDDTLLSHLSYEERELVEPLARLGIV